TGTAWATMQPLQRPGAGPSRRRPAPRANRGPQPREQPLDLSTLPGEPDPWLYRRSRRGTARPFLPGALAFAWERPSSLGLPWGSPQWPSRRVLGLRPGVDRAPWRSGRPRTSVPPPRWRTPVRAQSPYSRDSADPGPLPGPGAAPAVPRAARPPDRGSFACD